MGGIEILLVFFYEKWVRSWREDFRGVFMRSMMEGNDLEWGMEVGLR